MRGRGCYLVGTPSVAHAAQFGKHGRLGGVSQAARLRLQALSGGSGQNELHDLGRLLERQNRTAAAGIQ